MMQWRASSWDSPSWWEGSKDLAGNGSGMAPAERCSLCHGNNTISNKWMASAKNPTNCSRSWPVEAVVWLWHPGSHRSQNLHQLSHVVSEVGEVRLHGEVLLTHSSQNAPVLLRLLNQELSGQMLQVSQPLSGKQEEKERKKNKKSNEM